MSRESSRWDFVEAEEGESRADKVSRAKTEWRHPSRRKILAGAHAPVVVKTISSHTALSRFFSESQETNFEIKRIPGIPSPHSYSPRWPVYEWHGNLVFVREVYHRHYKVFSIPPGMELLPKGNE